METTTAKPVRNALAVILRDSEQPERFLVVKRPQEDGHDLSGHWGLPAVRLRPGELPEDAARRVCREKLGCDAVPLRLIGTMFQQRTHYDLFFMDIEMLLVGEAKPDIKQARTSGTAYIDQRWATDPRVLLPAARDGSCCSSIFLHDQGLFDREQWVTSLQNLQMA